MRFRQWIVIIALVVVLSGVIVSSFSDGFPLTGFAVFDGSSENITVEDNVTVDTDFDCTFDPGDDGLANVTWFAHRNDGSWDHWTADDKTGISVSPASKVSVTADAASSNTTKGEEWVCQVTLYNTTDSLTQNSTNNVTIVNSPPFLSNFDDTITVKEDKAFSKTAQASDSDDDEIVQWSSSDLSASSYPESLFEIDPSSGLVEFTVDNETMAGNHTMAITMYDGTNWGGRNIEFEIIPVNDSPEFGNLTFDCTEYTECNGTIPATDEEGDNLTFDSNISSLINLDPSDGSYSFTPQRKHVGILNATFNVTDNANPHVSESGYFNISSTNLPPNITTLDGPSLLQNESSESFVFTVNASDPDHDVNLSFSVTPDSCSIDPWNITKSVELNETTNASAHINVSFFDESTWLDGTTSSNDFVACRNVTVTVSDGLLEDERNVTFDITNVNDPPVIFNESGYPVNGLQTDIHNLSSATGLTFEYRVNTTDPDMRTYEGDTIDYSITGGNSSHFTINQTSGLITSTNLSINGNLSFDVVVNDSHGASVSETLNLTVMDNEAPNIISFNTSSCSEDSVCLKYLNATDEEGDNLTFEALNLTHRIPNGTLFRHASGRTDIEAMFDASLAFGSYSVNASGVSLTSYLLDFTPSDIDVGQYNLTFSFEDGLGISNTDSLVFNVTNQNDAPILNTSSFRDAVIVEDIPITTNITVSDPDLIYNLDNLTFNLSFINSSADAATITNYSFSKQNKTSATLSFTPDSTHIGEQTINCSVVDTASASDIETFNITVHPESVPPNITAVRPYYDTSTNTTVFSFSSDPPQNHTDITVYENETVEFDIGAIDENDDNMTLSWWFDGNLVSSETYTGVGSHPYIHSFSFFDNGTYTVTAHIEDEFYASSEYTWNVTVVNVNRDPSFLHPIQDYSFDNNRSINGFTEVNDFFRLHSSDIVFLDPDDDRNNNSLLDGDETNRLDFSMVDTSSCSDYLDFEISGKDVAITPHTVGTCHATFIATDPFGSGVASNEVRFDITDVDESSSSTSTTTSSSSGTQTVTERITIPLEEEVDTPEEFELIHAGISSMYENGTVSIPLTLKNTWDDELSTVSLDANASFDTNMSFSRKTFGSIPRNSLVEVNLTLSDYRFEGPYGINVSAHIESMEHTDTETIHVNALEKAQEDVDAVRSRIGFARDLLSDNSECQELTELLDRAKNKSTTQTGTSLEMVNNVIKGCKYLMDEDKEQPSTEMPKSLVGRLDTYGDSIFDFSELATVLAVVFVVVVIIGIFTLATLKRI